MFQEDQMGFKTTIIVSAAFAAGAFAPAFAGSAADYFTKMDTNADGVVTQAEYVSYKTAGGKHTAEKAEASFTKMAGDDAQLTMAELEGAMKAYKAKKKKDKAA